MPPLWVLRQVCGCDLWMSYIPVGAIYGFPIFPFYIPPIFPRGQYPLSQQVFTGAKGTLSGRFVGHVIATGKKHIKICPGTVLNYQVRSTLGAVICKVKNNHAAVSGRLVVNNHIKCSDKPAGVDKLKFKIKGSKKHQGEILWQ
jgi:hypothetical protein